MKKTIFLLLLLPMLASAQYFDVFDIDTSDYPIMKAKFLSFKLNGERILNHSISDFEITENGEPRDVISVSCNKPEPRPISVCLMVDTYKHIELARFGASRFVDYLAMPQNELGITYMDRRPLVYQDFTESKQKAIEKSKTIPPAPGYTQVEKIFFDDYAGGIKLIKDRTTQNRVLIYISDLHCPNLKINEQKLFEEIYNNDIRVYTLLLRTTDYTRLFARIAKESNGKVFENISSNSEIENIFKHISYLEQNDTCFITWKSTLPCKNIVNLSIKNKITNIVKHNRYYLDENELPTLEIKPKYIRFGEVTPGNTVDTTIELTSINHDLQIMSTNFSPIEPFSILETFPISIQKGETKRINIRFSPTDSLLTYSKLEFITDYCSENIGLLGGFTKKKLKTQTLHLLEPNGNEIFYAGNDTTIKWEGISENELLSFKFSSNSGKTWTNLSEDFTDLTKSWNIPFIESENCLIRISQILEKKQEGRLDSLYIYGGSYDDQIRSIYKTIDDGFIIAGLSISNDGVFKDTKGAFDFVTLKFNRKGEIEWSKNYGGGSDDIINDIIQTSSGEYIAAGYSQSRDSDLSGNNGQDDLVIIRINELGEIIWIRHYGGSRWDEARSVIEKKDGSLITVGYSNSNDGDIKLNKGGHDILLLRLDSLGNVTWKEIYGGSKDDDAYSIINTEDGGFAICGGSSSNDGDFNLNNGEFDVFVMKFDSNSVLEWSKLYGGSKTEYAKSIIQTEDNGFIISGFSNSSDGDVSKNNGKNDIWILKLDNNGTLLWSKVLGGSDNDDSIELILTNDKNVIILGNSYSSNGDLKTNSGESDFWLFKYNIQGDLLWSNNYGSIKKDIANAIIQNNENDFIITGTTYPTVTGLPNLGGLDILLAKVEGPPIPFQSDTSDAVFSIIMPEPVIQNNEIDMGEMIVGSTKDTIVSSVICNIGDAPLHVLGVDITGGNASDFLIPRGAGEFFLNKSECQDMMFEFTPSALGNRTAVATIRTTIGDFTDTIHIRGVGINPIIEATAEVVDFGKFELGYGKDTTLVLVKNVGSIDIIITDTRISGPDMEQFNFNSAATSYTILAGQEKEFKLNYTARYGGKTNSFLDFHYEGIGSPIRSLLFAEGIGGEVYPIMADAYVGENVNLNILLGKIKPEGLSEVATNFTATVSYNSSLLAPIDKSMSVSTEDDKSYIKITGHLSGVSQIAAIPMKVGLGTADRSGLVITEFQLYDANGDSVDYDIEPGVGEFNVLGICEEGGKRLINPNGEVNMQVIPENQFGNARVSLMLIETGQTEIDIYDQIGNKIETIYSGIPSAGQKEINLDLSKYANGRYYIKLTTPTITKTEIIEVVR
ncbi:MAG: hypothetical protein CVV25_11360 [Ignavibacteriae bacterium HGW-Ignavibacteriae-4]|nr:MAG: hypothetical protein CVV25_11360 [Ignavibacteriae bacterium HGW-Ignavibacteriae-4]